MSSHKRRSSPILPYLASYYRKFLPNFADLTLPLTILLKKGVSFKWSPEADKTFVDLKSRLASRPILRPPNYDLPFSMAIYASDAAVSAVLFQTVEDIEHPTCFLSRKLRKSEMNSTVEKEALALITAVHSFCAYFGSRLVTLCTDHRSLQFIQKMRSHNAKLLRWSLESSTNMLSRFDTGLEKTVYCLTCCRAFGGLIHDGSFC